MKRTLIGLLLLSGAAAVAPGPAQAQQLTLGAPNYGGTGCPQGTASVAVSPDARSLSILYDQYFVEVGPGTSLARRSCNLAIPLHVPQGFSVSILGIDYRGFNFLEPGPTARPSASNTSSPAARARSSRGTSPVRLRTTS